MRLVTLLILLIPAMAVGQSVSEMRAMDPPECVDACVRKGLAEESCSGLEVCTTQCRGLCGLEVKAESDLAWSDIVLRKPNPEIPRWEYLSIITEATDVLDALGSSIAASFGGNREQSYAENFTGHFQIRRWAIGSETRLYDGPSGPDGGETEFTVHGLLNTVGAQGWEFLSLSKAARNQYLFRFRRPYYGVAEHPDADQ